MKRKAKKRKNNSRRKGAVGERELSEELRKFGWQARRGQQFSGGGESPDVVHNIPGIHIEAKRVEQFQLYKALDQATNDAAGKKVPVVAHRKNGREWVVILRLQDFLGLHLLTPQEL